MKNGRTEAYCDHCKKTFVKRTQDGAIHLEERKQVINVQQNIVNIQQNIVNAPAKVGESKFTGTYGSLLGNRIVNSLISLITLGFGIPWVICRSHRWVVDHTVIDGRRLKFDGTAGNLFGSWIKWMFLTLITCGIYGLWVPLKRRAWIVEHSHIEGLAGESKFTGGLASFLGLQIVNALIMIFTLGLGLPWVVCRTERWDSEHQIIDGQRIYFDGNAAQLFGNWIKWILLTIITFGIYSVVIPIRKQAWIVKHQSFVKPVGNSGQSMGDSGKPMSNSRKLTDDSNQRKKTGKIVGCVIAVVVVAAIIVACVLFIPSITTWYTSEGLAYSVEIVEGTCFIRGIKDRTQTDIVIPEEIDGYKVTEIYDNAFSGCTSLTSIVIPDSVTHIFYNAFDGCTNIVEATIPAWAIDYIPKDTLKTVVITSGTKIGLFAFSGCESLTSVTIPDTVTTIGSYAFYDCDSLTSIVIPDSVTSIGREAFYDCSSIESITIPNSVASIGEGAFIGCFSLSSVYYGGTVEDWANITIGSDNTRLENATCYYYSETKPTTYGNFWRYVDGEVVIWEYAEKASEGLEYTLSDNGTYYSVSRGTCTDTEIIVPSEYYGIPVTIIGDSAFSSCDSLTSIIIPDSVTTIGEWAFYGCTSLTTVTFGENSQLTTIDSSAFEYCTSLTSVIFGENSQLTSIGDYAFDGCDSLTSIVIPDSVTTIGSYAFSSCDSLTSLVIPDSVTSIGDWAFFHCDSLTSVTIGDNVTSIGEDAFYYCTRLTSVTFSRNSQLTTIDEWAFAYCRSLTSIFVPDSVTSIGSDAFYHCDSLTSITFEDTTTWYRTTDDDDWSSKTGGTKTSVTDPLTNATYLTSTYNDYYWYKL